MIGRRIVWGVVGAAALLMVARVARAGSSATGDGLAVRDAAPRPLPATGVGAAPERAAATRGTSSAGFYAAESARTATRLPAEEREARQFLRAAATVVRFEMEASRIAQQRGHAPELRSFASELFDQRESSEAELLHLLHGRGMAAPMMETAQRKALQRLSKLTGPRFDREYIELVGLHQQRGEIQQYERAVLGMSDPVLKAWVDRQLPQLRAQHATAAQLGLVDGRRAAPVPAVRPVSVVARPAEPGAARQRTE